MGIVPITNGEARSSYVAKINDLVDYWHGAGTAEGFDTGGQVRAKLNAMAGDLALPAFANGENLGQVRAKINALIDETGIPTDASLYLDFMAGRYFGSQPDFTRLSEASFAPDGGPLEMYPQNVLRRDSRGALLERAGTRHNTHPTPGEEWVQRRVVLQGVTVAPDGSNTAPKAVPTTENNNHYLSRISGLTGVTDQVITVSIFAKAAEFSSFAMWSSGGDPRTTVTFNIATGETSAYDDVGGWQRIDQGIIPAGNGWFRCWMSFSVPADNTTDPNILLFPNSQSFVPGDGVSGIWLWGLQVEAGTAYPSSYMPEPADAQASRAADLLTVPVQDGGRAGVIELNPLESLTSPQDVRYLANWSDGSYSNRYLIYLDSLGRLRLSSSAGGVFDTDALVDVPSLPSKMLVYFVLAPNHRQTGLIGIGESGVGTTLREPANINMLGIGSLGWASTQNTNIRARRFMEILNPPDPEAAFAQVKAIAEEWANA